MNSLTFANIYREIFSVTMKLFDRNLLIESFNIFKTAPVLDEMAALYEETMTNIAKDTTVPQEVLDSFKIKSELNPNIWENGHLNPKIRIHLIKFANDFFKSLKLPETVKLKDIIFTGSLANYNWSQFSDIDLHLVIEFSELADDEAFVQEFMDAHKNIWNTEHNVKVFQFPIEVYVQDVKATVEATAIYSLVRDKWILKPKKENFKLDTAALKRKTERILDQLKEVKKDYDNQDYKKVVDKTTLIKDKVKRMRKMALEQGGEFALENLVFKALRRTPFFDHLDSFKSKAYDKLMSIVKPLHEAIFNQGGVLLLYGQPLEDGTRRLYVTTAKQLTQHNRVKMDSSAGIPNRNVTINNNVYRLSMEDGRLKAKGVAWSSPDGMKKALGLNGSNVGLHYNKTPMHQETLQYNNIEKMLHNLHSSIVHIPDVRWQG